MSLAERDEKSASCILRAFLSCGKTDLALSIVQKKLVHNVVHNAIAKLGMGGRGLEHILEQTMEMVKSTIAPLERAGNGRFAFVSQSVWPEIAGELSARSSLVFASGMLTSSPSPSPYLLTRIGQECPMHFIETTLC